jgi:copper(I)-binding protein
MPSSRPSSASGGTVLASLRLLVLGALLGATAACTSGATPLAATVTVSGAWVRVAATTGAPTAAYLVIANPGGQADALLSVSTPAASAVEIHQTSTDMNGMTGMAAIPRLEVPAGGTVQLAPGGFHLMVTGLKAPLTAGGTIELDLVFEHAGRVVVQADVRAG